MRSQKAIRITTLRERMGWLWRGMPRPLRIEYGGARYHVCSRGDHQEDIFFLQSDRQRFLKTLAECCTRTGWQIHAYCLMTNHIHLVIETPQPNLSVGMKWLLAPTLSCLTTFIISGGIFLEGGSNPRSSMSDHPAICAERQITCI